VIVGHELGERCEVPSVDCVVELRRHGRSLRHGRTLTAASAKHVRHLPWISIGNAVNLRDTGGLACRDGATTRHRALLRSGTLRQLTAGDAVTLIEVCGVRTVLDLRTARELASEGPSALARAGLATVHLPLIRDDQLALPEAEDQADVTAALRRAYQSYLDERGHHIATAARLVAASAGATLVHCAAGKDRTGVTVALLLDAVGVERSEVIAD
jgi:protein tyrosine/serine phosphatase